MFEYATWQVLNTVLHQAAGAFADSVRLGEDGFRAAAELTFEGLEDKFTLVCGHRMMDKSLDPDIRELFTQLFAARIRSRMHLQYLDCSEAEFLKQLPQEALVAWEEFEALPHDPLQNDCDLVTNLISKNLDSYVPISSREFEGRIFWQKPGKNLLRKSLDPDSDSDESRSEISSTIDSLTPVEVEDAYRDWADRAGLTELEADTFWLINFEDYEQKEVMDALRLRSIGSVKQAIRRARAKLQETGIRV